MLLLPRVYYSNFCSAAGMRHILFSEAEFSPKRNGSFIKFVFCVFWIMIKMLKQRDLNFFFKFFLKEIIARNLSYKITLSHINIFCAFLAIFGHFVFVEANFAENLRLCYFFVKNLRLRTQRHILSGIGGMRHSPKLRHPVASCKSLAHS